MAGHVRAMTQHSPPSRKRLERNAREVRERGYAVSRKQVTLHANAECLRVCYSGAAAAFVSLSGIEQRFMPERLPELIQRTVAAGDGLSRRLGYREPAKPLLGVGADEVREGRH